MAVSDSEGFVEVGPLAGDEWWADISAPGHCPVRMLMRIWPEGGAPREGHVVNVWRSRRRRGVLVVDGGVPPVGTTVHVRPEAWGDTIESTYIRIARNGTFVFDDPIGGWLFFRVDLPDGRGKSFWAPKSGDPMRVVLD